MVEHSILIRADDIPLVKFVRTMRRKVFKESPENAMFRAYQTNLNASGFGQVFVSPDVDAVEWDIYQISVVTQTANTNTHCMIRHNGFFLCSTPKGWEDTSVGPPDAVVLAHDILAIQWISGSPNELATAGIWYNENPSGTTYSSAH